MAYFPVQVSIPQIFPVKVILVWLISHHYKHDLMTEIENKGDEIN